MNTVKIQADFKIVYNDGRTGHTNATATVLSVSESGMVVQFDDRADTTSIQFDDESWMKYLSVVSE